MVKLHRTIKTLLPLSCFNSLSKLTKLFSCDFLLLLFFGRLLVQRERKEATQNFGLRGFCYYSEGYFCTFVILSIRLLGCLSNAHELLRALLEKFISSSGRVL